MTHNSAKPRFKIGDIISFTGLNNVTAEVLEASSDEYKLIYLEENSHYLGSFWCTYVVVHNHFHIPKYKDTPVWRMLEGIEDPTEAQISPLQPPGDKDE